MLSEGSYLTAILCYVGAACLALLYIGWFLSSHWRAGWVALVVLLGAVLLLTPAYPQEGVDTLAPALIVAGFQMLTDGPESAMHALRPLAALSGLAIVLAMLFGLATRFRRNRSSETSTGDNS